MWLIRRAKILILTTGMLALPMLGAVALHRMSAFGWLTVDWSDPLGWLARTPPEDMAAAMLRHVGLAGCYWLSTASVTYTAGRLAGLSRVVAALRPLTPRIVRSVADRVVIGAVALSSLGVSPAPAIADHHQPPIVDPIELRASVGEVTAETPALAFVRDDYIPYQPPSPISAILDAHHESTRAPAENSSAIASLGPDYLPHDVRSSSRTVEATSHRDTVEVQQGDSLWVISAQHLTSGLNRAPTQAEIRDHWHATIEANLPNLRSDDPDLIHPGEVITLPALPQPPNG